MKKLTILNTAGVPIKINEKAFKKVLSNKNIQVTKLYPTQNSLVVEYTSKEENGAYGKMELRDVG